MKKADEVLQFRVALQTVEPEVWRRIQIPSQRATFWSLHCAIQDSLGWRDCHLHLFFAAVDGQMSQIGIPDDPGWDPQPVRASWLTRLAPNLTMDGQKLSLHLRLRR